MNAYWNDFKKEVFFETLVRPSCNNVYEVHSFEISVNDTYMYIYIVQWNLYLMDTWGGDQELCPLYRGALYKEVETDHAENQNTNITIFFQLNS